MNEGIDRGTGCAQTLEQLQQENARLVALLEAHGIECGCHRQLHFEFKSLNQLQMPAYHWCSSEPPGITLREMKHSYPGGNRVLSLLVLELAAPRGFASSGWEDERDEDSYDRFISRGQRPY
ncbi:MAG TPA: hypothetical protein DEW09_14090 [Pseudomonas sp.]|uniref:hypothetical protein n=1 Tax=Stutzerimonas balearica TaxID=74829 RepID=UPI000EE208A5|nr:hypothetical protein [Stutzerimonas balearica]HCG40175.1 hypothetical protein [Pseudomonas sp.]